LSSKSTFSNSTSKSYAIALYELSKENSELDKVEDEMKKLNKLLDSSADFKEMIINPTVAKDDKKNVIDSIKITGDFFIHPEETLETLEANLVDTKLERNEISKKVEVSLKDSEAFGFDVNSMTDAIMGCLKNE